MKFVYSVVLGLLLFAAARYMEHTRPAYAADIPRQQPEIFQNSITMISNGRQAFRYDTFGDEAFWGDTLQLHKAIEGQKFAGGVGPGVSPVTALSVGLKVDSDLLPADLIRQVTNGGIDLN